MKSPFLAASAFAVLLPMAAQAQSSVDLSAYTRVGRYDLPEPTRTTPPNGTSLLAQEASAVTYDQDTGTLFVMGDGGTSVVQVSTTGQYIDSMTLASDPSKPQGTYFYDTEGLTYVGNGQFVMAEERYRQLDQFTYAPNTTLTGAQVQTVKLGTTIGNVGIEGVSNDPLSGGLVVVKEKQPSGIFLTNVDFKNGTASNGSPSTVNSTNLFDPAKLGLADFSDVYAMSNSAAFAGTAAAGNLLVLSQESGKIVETDRAGNVLSTLVIQGDPGGLSVADAGHEGLTMDNQGNLYVVSENGGGNSNQPQLWVYSIAAVPEPSGYAMSLAGLMLLGGMVRRKRFAARRDEASVSISPL